MQGRLHQTLAGTSWLLALLTLLLGGLAWHRSHLQSLAQHNLTCDHALLSRLMVLRNLHDRMALHARCYERTGQAADLQPFHTAATDLAANVSPLRRLAGHDQRQQELLTQLELTAHDCLTLADHVLHVGRGHDHTTARWLLASDGTRQLHARLDQLLIQAGGRAAAAVRHHAAAAASHASGTGWWILFGTLTAAGGIVLTGRRLTCLDQRLGEAETQLRSARQEMEQRVAERTAEINTVNVGLQAEIQERQRIEDALHRAHGELELRVDQRTHELAQANLELQREIAERRRIAEALKNSRALYHSLVENLPVHIWRTNLEGQYTFGNEHLCDCLGVSQEEFLGRTAHDFFQPDVAEKFLRDDRKVIESGDPLEDIEEVVTLQHRRSFQQVLKTPCYDEAGRMIGVQGIGWDVTERKEAEEEKQRILAQLEESHRHLVARNEEIQNFYHTLSHELKTPLTSAREFVSIVLEGIAGPLNDAQREYLNIARESCNQMRVCINDLLDATRLETGKLSLDRQPADLGALAQKVVSAQQPAAAGRRIALTAEIEPGLPSVLADEHRILQVINNLVTNALKFTAEGGTVTVTVRRPAGRQDALEVAVADNGRGIAREDLDRIFDRLFQVRAGDATTAQGIGLGLFLCRELVNLHGGSIEVQSEVGKGSTFRFLLPVAAPPPSPSPAARRKLLVVDDDPLLRELLRQILEQANFSVITAASGRDALETMQHQTPDVVLLDLAMPDLDGAATLGQIRRQWGPLPVILHTGFPEGELMDRARQGAPFTLLTKPCPPDRLIRTACHLAEEGAMSA